MGPVLPGISKAKVRDKMQRLRGRKAVPQIEAWCLENNIHKGKIRDPNSSPRSYALTLGKPFHSFGS